MTQTDYIKFADVKVMSCAPVHGKYGEQWQLSILVPPSKHPSNFWLDQAGDGGDAPIEPDKYWAEFTRGALRDGKDGSADWDYNWRIVTLSSEEPHPPEGDCPHVAYNYEKGQAPQPASRPTSGPGQQARSATQAAQTEFRQGGAPAQPAPRAVSVNSLGDAEDRKRASIHRQVALKAAVECTAVGGTSTSEEVLRIAQAFVGFLDNVPPEPNVAPEPDDSAPEASSGDEEPNPFDEGSV